MKTKRSKLKIITTTKQFSKPMSIGQSRTDAIKLTVIVYEILKTAFSAKENAMKKYVRKSSVCQLALVTPITLFNIWII